MNKYDNLEIIQHHPIIQTQNPVKTQSYQTTQMQNPTDIFLQQHQITKNQLTNFSEIPNAAKSHDYK